MAQILATIAEHVRTVVERRRREAPIEMLRDRPLFHLPRRGFARSLTGQARRIIAEIKKASPSKGLIRADFEPVSIAKDYTDGGASAISVLTEERFFEGCLTYLEEIHDAVSVPLLRKDFMLDPYQIVEAKSYGADAVLFIAALLDPALLRELCGQAADLSLDALVEVHTEKELACAVAAGAQLIGVNNRDLKTFAVDLATTERPTAGDLCLRARLGPVVDFVGYQTRGSVRPQHGREHGGRAGRCAFVRRRPRARHTSR